MVAIIDIMASFIVGGIILVMSTKLGFVISDNGQQANVSLTAQQNCVLLSEMIESDLAKTGYRKTGYPVATADSAKVKFYGDIDDNGTLDSVTYYSGPMTSAYASLNPRHKLMYRTWNKKTTTMNLGVTSFKIVYYDSAGAKTTVPSRVQSFKVSMDFEGLIPMSDSSYATVHWEQYIKPKVFQFSFN
jgi:hypothetical protein